MRLIFLKSCSVLLLLSVLVAACSSFSTPLPPAPTQPPQVIKQTVIVFATPQATNVVATATAEPVKEQLLVFNWWTDPNERAAADAMYKAFNTKYPYITIENNPIPGVGSMNPRVVLQARLAAGLPPDSWQTLAGAELKTYVDAGQLQPLDNIYQAIGYDKLISKSLLNAVSINGHPYSVPFDMDIQNILYFNKKLFDDLKITPPTTYNELIATCKQLRIARPDVTCIALGSKEEWEDAFVFDSLLLGEPGGAQHYVDVYKGKVDVSADKDYKDALTKLAALVPYFNINHPSLTWDQSVALVGAGKAAMTLMDTRAIGAFMSGSNWQPGVDFDAVIFPSKPARILLFHADTYGSAIDAQDQDACEKWLSVVASQELQVPADVTHGSLFARTDIDPTRFPDPIRQELQTYANQNTTTMILDQVGGILPLTLQPQYWDAIATFTLSPKDVYGTARAIQTLFTTNDVKTASAWYQWP